MESSEFMFNLLLQIFLPVTGSAFISLYFLNREKISMKMAKLAIHLVFILTVAFYFFHFFLYGIFGMKDYMYIKNNLSETKFEEFKKKSKELETSAIRATFSRQIINDIDEKKFERDKKRISNFKR